VSVVALGDPPIGRVFPSGGGQGRAPMCGRFRRSNMEVFTLRMRDLGKDMNDIHDAFRQLGLTRPQNDRVLGGVCAGLGRRVGLDPWPARLLFVLLLLVLPGTQLLIYPILWILMPSDAADAVPVAPTAQPEPPS
jgi:phage shock protein C